MWCTVQDQALLLAYFSKSFSFCEPQFSHLGNGNRHPLAWDNLPKPRTLVHSNVSLNCALTSS